MSGRYRKCTVTLVIGHKDSREEDSGIKECFLCIEMGGAESDGYSEIIIEGKDIPQKDLKGAFTLLSKEL